MSGLTKVSDFFDLDSVDHLWAKDINQYIGPPDRAPGLLERWQRRKDWPIAEKLMELLGTDEYEILAQLVEWLYT